jgi:hypothetical protein
MLYKFVLSVMCSHVFLTVQCVLFLILNVMDGYTTWLVMKPDHYERERNPVARWVFRKLHAPVSIIFFKVLVLGFLADFIAYWWQEALTINIALLIGNLLFLFVVPHNMRVHYRYTLLEKVNSINQPTGKDFLCG